jgi:hypothetical protein
MANSDHWRFEKKRTHRRGPGGVNRVVLSAISHFRSYPVSRHAKRLLVCLKGANGRHHSIAGGAPGWVSRSSLNRAVVLLVLMFGNPRIPTIRPAQQRRRERLNWIGGIFLGALIAIAFSIYSDVGMTHCEPRSFAAVVGMCKVAPR